ncbi:hypothetical protein BGZ83_003749 [Gryganskiella cystojenkinii]|nr:hypothetical protein BGZ83_003749 [Gryganskiella cystojenkinii]
MSDLHQEKEPSSVPHKQKDQQQLDHDEDRDKSLSATRSNKMHKRPDPLTIPELIHLLSRQLDPRSRRSCAQVCRQWYQILSPVNWASVTIHHTVDNPSLVLESSPDILQRHAASIQELCISPSYAVDKLAALKIAFPNLKKFTINSLVNPEDDEEDGSVSCSFTVDLIERYGSTLVSLSIDNVNWEPILNAIETHCSQLKELRIRFLLLDRPEQWINRFDTLFSRMQVLALGGPLFSISDEENFHEEQEIIEKWIAGPRPPSGSSCSADESEQQPQRHELGCQIQDLSIFMSRGHLPAIAAHQGLILKSPLVRRLRWDISDPKVIFDHGAWLVQVLRDRRPPPPKLLLSPETFESLTIQFIVCSERHFLDLLELLRGLKTLKLRYYYVFPWQSIKREIPSFLTTIRSLDLLESDIITGEVAHDLLCTLPNLECFRTDYIRVANLLEDPPRPWLCQDRLKHLQVAFVPLSADMAAEVDSTWTAKRRKTRSSFVTVSSPSSESVVFARLASLTGLEILDLNMQFLGRGWGRDDIEVQENIDQNPTLHLTLDRGLERLKDLRKVRTIAGPRYENFSWTGREARWALQHWVDLEKVSNMTLTQEAEQILKPSVQLHRCKITEM